MNAKSDYDVSQMFDSAINAFGDTMKAGVKAQEEIVKWWSNALDGGGPLSDWQKRSKQLFDEAVPAAQRNAEEWLRMVEQNYRRSIDLLKRAMDADQSGAVNSLRDRTRKLWEESLTVVKENAESMAQANVKMMELWTDLIRKHLEQTEAAMKQAATSAAAVASGKK